MNLNDITPRMEGHHPKFVSSENRCTHIGLNPAGRSLIRQYLVDGDVFPKGREPERCDYLLINDTDKKSYYIELKGSSLIKAISQVETTAKALSPFLKGYDMLFRIIYGTGTHDIHSSKVLRWKNRNKKAAVIKSVKYEETI